MPKCYDFYILVRQRFLLSPTPRTTLSRVHATHRQLSRARQQTLERHPLRTVQSWTSMCGGRLCCSTHTLPPGGGRDSCDCRCYVNCANTGTAAQKPAVQDHRLYHLCPGWEHCPDHINLYRAFRAFYSTRAISLVCTNLPQLSRDYPLK